MRQGPSLRQPFQNEEDNVIEFRDIDNDFDSFAFLVDFYHQNKERSFETIDISFKSVTWIAANCCAFIGAMFQKLEKSFNRIRIHDLQYEKVKNVLERNGFLSFWGYPKIPDYKGTTIDYLKLDPDDHKFFSKYVHHDLLDLPGIPVMTPRLRRKISEGIIEIFMNAGMHSESRESIYACGQFFPRKNKIFFTVADLGIGIKSQVSRYFGKAISSIDAIYWALVEGNTTKKNSSGGLGLSILKEFITLNKGKIQVVSDDGFFESSPNVIKPNVLENKFPGTAVTLCINTDDQMHYSLKSESISDEDLF